LALHNLEAPTSRPPVMANRFRSSRIALECNSRPKMPPKICRFRCLERHFRQVFQRLRVGANSFGRGADSIGLRNLEGIADQMSDSHKVYYGIYLSVYISITCGNLILNYASIVLSWSCGQMAHRRSQFGSCSVASAPWLVPAISLRGRDVAAAPGHCNKPVARWQMTRRGRVRIG
jgi:hypothetical protein